MEIEARIATLELAETFVISRESADTADVVQVEIRHDGHAGYGEGAPIERDGEAAEAAVAYIGGEGGAPGGRPWACEAITEGAPRGESAWRAWSSARAPRPPG